jgi:Fe-S cluster assembly protein SufD
MSELANNLAQELRVSDHSEQWLNDLRRNGLKQFQDLGLPDKRDEEWKYTSLLSLEQQKPALGQFEPDAQPVYQAKPIIDSPVRVVMLDGEFSATEGTLVDGLRVRSLRSVLDESTEEIQTLLQSLESGKSGQGFAALNAATLNPGLVIQVEKNVDAGEILIQWQASASSDLFNSRVLVILEEGASLHVLEQLENRPEDVSRLSQVTQIELKAGSKLQQTRVQDLSAGSLFISRTQANQGSRSQLGFTVLDLGKGLTRHDVKTRLNGKGASCDLNGACVGSEQSHTDHHLEAAHVAEGCESSQLFRAVAMDKSRVVFNGKVHVFKGADGTEAKQSSAGLLLSPLAEIDAKPELEIYADEVIASHGATVGQLDDKALFYLQSRGLAEKEARQILTMAFCRTVTDQYDDLSLRETLGDRLSDALEAGIASV